jgi:hypothetical protein
MSERKNYFSPTLTVTEMSAKDIITLSVIDNSNEDGTYVGENSAFWEG